jgi:predicted O-linked N-acetylglucosamine transferase (SPINDLY family)
MFHFSLSENIAASYHEYVSKGVELGLSEELRLAQRLSIESQFLKGDRAKLYAEDFARKIKEVA